MKASSIAIGAGLAGLAIALLSWWALQSEPAFDGQGGQPANPSPTDGGAPPSVAPTRAAIPDALPNSQLTVRPITPTGGQTAGAIAWICSKAPPAGGSLTTSSEGVSTEDYRGSAAVSVPHGHWTWLVVRSNGMHRYALVEPFEGHAERRIEITPQRATLHAFVRSRGNGAPAADRTVTLLQRGGQRQGGVAEKLEEVTDHGGYARFELGPGAYVASIGEPRPGSPATRPFALSPGMMGADPIILLEVSETTAPLTLELQVAGDPAAWRPRPILLLESRSSLEQPPIPIWATLREGRQKVELDVPPGDYEVTSLPPGELLLSRNRPVVSVAEAGATTSLAVRRNPDQTRVELLDLPANQFPIRVSVLPSDSLFRDPDFKWFLGPQHWRSGEQTIRRLDQAYRVIVRGRSSWFVSVDAVDLSAPLARVPLVEASTVEILWQSSQRVARPSIASTDSPFAMQTALRPRWLSRDGQNRLCYHGVLLGHRDTKCVVTCQGPAGETNWEREVTLDRPRMLLEVTPESSTKRDQ